MPKSKLSSIKSGVFSRGMALAKISINAGSKAASHAIGNFFAEEGDKPDRLKAMMMSQVSVLAQELGQLKGSLMKVGQMLSMYGEHFLPPEVNQVLKSLQSNSPALEWPAIEKVLKRELSADVLVKLTIDPEPLAAASIGQVHRARRNSDGRELAMKIQYPGIDKTIDRDIQAFQTMLSLSKLLPSGPNYDELFKEVRTMLNQEVDYEQELKATLEYRERIGNDPRFIVPEVFPEFSNRHILTTSFEDGVRVDGPEVLALSQERRDHLGKMVLDLYYQELLEWRAIQTDPHFGNYRVRLGEKGEPDRLILFDFGAMRKISKEFLDPYKEMIAGAMNRDLDRLAKGALGAGFLNADDSDEQKKVFAKLCFLITEPFSVPGTEGTSSEFMDQNGNYDWHKTDLPKRSTRAATEYAKAFKLRAPPREVVFLDRKMGGVFIFLSVLNVKFNARDVLLKYL